MKNIYITFHVFIQNILHIKSSRIPVMENDVNTTYQVMGRQQITLNMIHDYSSRKNIYLISRFLHKKFFLLTHLKLMLISMKYKAKYQFGFVPA